MIKFLSFVAVLGTFSSVMAQGQDRVQPGRLYSEGEPIHGTMVGVETKIPIGWSGMIPHDSEIFFLLPNSGDDIQLFVRAYEGTIDEVKQGWTNGSGVELQPGLVIRSDGNIVERAGWITSEVIVEGDQARKRQFRGYLEARCGEFGHCLTLFLVAPEANYQRYLSDTQKFADDITFVEPTLDDIFANFDWKEFLQNKYAVTYESYQNYNKENHVWLCPDGTFRTKLNRKGKLARSERGDYSGKNSGNWTADGVGPKGQLTLSFAKKNLDPINVELFIEENKVYMNGERYFMMDNQECK